MLLFVLGNLALALLLCPLFAGPGKQVVLDILVFIRVVVVICRINEQFIRGCLVEVHCIECFDIDLNVFHRPDHTQRCRRRLHLFIILNRCRIL